MRSAPANPNPIASQRPKRGKKKKNLARFIATGKEPELIRPFSLSRFYRNNLLGEKASAAVTH